MASLTRLPISRAFAAASLVALPFLQMQAQGAGETIFHRYRVLEPSVRKAGMEVAAHRFDEARRILEPVLKEVPDHAEAHFLLAKPGRNSGRPATLS